jgi:15-cis-phytoene synthase
MNAAMEIRSDRKSRADQATAGLVIRRHSRSFSIASRMLPARIRSSVYCLYAWCRTVDDAVDEATSLQEAEELLDILEQDLDRLDRGQAAEHAASAWIKPLVTSRAIDVKHAKELIAGMRMDLDPRPITTEADLMRYCYHAAGTVGLMMTRLMGVRNPVADRHAIALGVAMQLTNIARDVREDSHRGRCYLPGISRPLTDDPRRTSQAVRHVLELADRNYQVASAGLAYLPRDVRLAIRMALSLYREIGIEIQRHDYEVLKGRTVVSKPRLIRVLASTLVQSLRSDLKNFFVSIPLNFLENPMNELKTEAYRDVAQAKHAVYLGLSLTAIMAAALFVMVFVNPKETSYTYLPLIYSGVSLISAVVFNRLAARCEIGSR